jgi:thiamine-phosphate pyrophosphorylase
VLALTDDRIASLEDLGIRAAAIAAAGAAMALVARLPHGTADQLAALAQRLGALAAPPMASVWVTGRVDVAVAVGAHGVVLRRDDVPVAVARDVNTASDSTPRPAGTFRVIRSVHSLAEAAHAAADGADALIAGTIWPSATHAGRAAAGTAWLREMVGTGLPVYAIGGVTADRARDAAAAGAWGVAAISGLWDASRPHEAAVALADIMNGTGS